MWGGRFTDSKDSFMTSFNSSIAVDSRLAIEDLVASQHYAKFLYASKLITLQQSETINHALSTIAQEWNSNAFTILSDDEDIHSANERRLTEIIGPSIAGKLHTGRSRNDQVATDMRLWLVNNCKLLLESLKTLIKTVADRALLEIDVLFPGYTHLQRAQPIRWSHWLLSHAWAWHADALRLSQIITRTNLCPLGSGALAGNPFDIDRKSLATSLGFLDPIPNSLYAVSDRDFVSEFLFWSTLTMSHLGRLSEDLIIYSTTEFGFVQLSDAYSTGSSLMPQKKNPDSLELIRGKSGRVFGNMAGFLMTMKALPSTYNKDMQEDKEAFFDSFDTVMGCITISNRVLDTLQIFPEKMKSALSMDMLATDLAEYLVRKGVPFRETHHISGRAVKLAEERKCQLNELSLDDLKSLHDSFDKDVENVWDFENSVENRNSYGGTSRATVLEQIQSLHLWCKNFGTEEA